MIIVLLFFNVSFSLPKDFSEFIEERMAMGNFEEIERITIQKSYWLENGHLIKPEDDREFVIESKDEIQSLLNSPVRVYDGGRFSRDEENEYEIYLYFKNDHMHRYLIGEKYMILSIDSNAKEETVHLKVLSDTNEIYHYFKNLYQ